MMLYETHMEASKIERGLQTREGERRMCLGYPEPALIALPGWFRRLVAHFAQPASQPARQYTVPTATMPRCRAAPALSGTPSTASVEGATAEAVLRATRLRA